MKAAIIGAIIIIIVLILKKIYPYIYMKLFYYEVPYDIPATISTFTLQGYNSYSDKIYKKYNLMQHFVVENPELIFEKGHQFENKIDGKLYDFPFYEDHYKLDHSHFYKYGYDAKIICRFKVTVDRLDGEIIEWKLFAIKPIEYGNRDYELKKEIEDPSLVLHREWRKNGYPKGCVIPQYEINKYDKILSKEDGLCYYKDQPPQEELDRYEYEFFRDKIRDKLNLP